MVQNLITKHCCPILLLVTRNYCIQKGKLFHNQYSVAQFDKKFITPLDF